MTMALHGCDEVAVAGFGYDMSMPNAPLHYYETVRMAAIKEVGLGVRPGRAREGVRPPTLGSNRNCINECDEMSCSWARSPEGPRKALTQPLLSHSRPSLLQALSTEHPSLLPLESIPGPHPAPASLLFPRQHARTWCPF